MSYEQNVVWKGKNLIIGCLAVLVLGISIIVAFNLKTSPQGGTTGRPVPPEPLVRLPPELVKDLVSKGVSTIALMEENDHVKQVVGLFPDGRCEGGIQDLEESTVQVSLLRSPEFETSNFVVEPARALSCSRGCESCSSGNCRKSLGSCFNCQ